MNRSAFINLIKSIVFSVIFLFLIVSLSYIMRTNGDTKDRFSGFYAEKKNTIDVLMIGSSTVGTSFIPAYLWGNYGFTSYPLSSNSQRPKAIKYIIDEGLKYQDPSLVVIEMRTFIMEDSYFSSDEGHIREIVDNMKYSTGRIRSINALTEEFDDKTPFYLDLIKYHSNWGILMNPEEWKKYDFVEKNPDKGFVYLYEDESFKDDTIDVYTEARLPLPSEQEAVLRDLLGYLTENDIPALFVVSPREKMEGYEEMMNYAGDIITQAGFDFLDLNFMNKETDIKYSHDFNDGAHTNIWGAVKASKVLGQHIKDNYDVSRQHDDQTVKDWDEAYDRFVTIYNNAVVVE